jgi:hypothetical protein
MNIPTELPSDYAHEAKTLDDLLLKIGWFSYSPTPGEMRLITDLLLELKMYRALKHNHTNEPLLHH